MLAEHRALQDELSLDEGPEYLDLKRKCKEAHEKIETIEGKLDTVRLHSDETVLRELQPLGRAQQRELVKGALNALTGMAAHGFVHGDIKPANMLMDRSNGRLQVIDLGGVRKISKTNASPLTNLAHSPAYTNPRSFSLYRGPDENYLKASAGHEQDVFGMGVSLMEFHFRSQKRHDLADQLLANVAACNYESHGYAGQISKEERIRKLEDHLNRSMVEVAGGPLFDFAKQCLTLSLSVNAPETSRYDPDNPQPDHLLTRLNSRAALADELALMNGMIW